MSADLLREAANLMRERAEAASPSPWSEYGYPVETVTGEGGESTVRDPDGFDVALMTSDQFDDCPHIASWHPAVALAVADWLEATADEFDTECPSTYGDAIAVATTYLGRDA